MAKKKKIELKEVEEGVVKAGPMTRWLASSSKTSKTIGEASREYRYIDFVDHRSGRPCLCMEWLFGSRGLVVGRVLNLIANFSRGKSSFMYYMYACAQRMPGGAFCHHIESEGAQAPADFVAGFGANPDMIQSFEAPSLEECLEWIDTEEAKIRGSWGKGGINPATGRIVKSKFDDPFDAELELPVVFGIDSISSLGMANDAMTDVMGGPSKQPAMVAKALRTYLKARVQRFNQRAVTMLIASHQTKNIDMGGFGYKAKDADVSSIAREAIGIHSTYEILLDSKKWMTKEAPYVKLGDISTLTTTKNKISPKDRSLPVYMRTGTGYDMAFTDYTWLTTHPASPFVDKELQKRFGTIATWGKRITWNRPDGEKVVSQGEDEFLDTLYKDEEMLKGIREALRIRGYGLSFETDYIATMSRDPNEDNLSDIEKYDSSEDDETGNEEYNQEEDSE